MNNKGGSSNENSVDIAELNSLSERKARFSIQSNNTKPYDISKMTGKPSNQGNNRQEG